MSWGYRHTDGWTDVLYILTVTKFWHPNTTRRRCGGGQKGRDERKRQRCFIVFHRNDACAWLGTWHSAQMSTYNKLQRDTLLCCQVTAIVACRFDYTTLIVIKPDIDFRNNFDCHLSRVGITSHTLYQTAWQIIALKFELKLCRLQDVRRFRPYCRVSGKSVMPSSFHSNSKGTN